MMPSISLQRDYEASTRSDLAYAAVCVILPRDFICIFVFVDATVIFKVSMTF